LEKKFKSREKLDSHLESSHQSFVQVRIEEEERARVHRAYQRCFCHLCGKAFRNRTKLDIHIQGNHTTFYDIVDQVGFGSCSDPILFHHAKQAHNWKNVTYVTVLKELEPDVSSVHDRSKAAATNILHRWVGKFKNIKVFAQMRGKFHKQKEECKRDFTTFCHTILNSGQISTVFNLICNNIIVQIEDFTYLKSGWTLDSILDFRFTVLQDRALSGSSYIKTPFPLNRKKCIVNVDNSASHNDNREDKCFVYSVLAHKKFIGAQFINNTHDRYVYRKSMNF
jgi:hypothetical protein